MKVRFLQDYRGVLTGEVFYQSGDEATLPDGDQLVKAGRAVVIMADKPAPKRKPTKKKVKK